MALDDGWGFCSLPCMNNHIPAAHFHTVVNALHERSCAMTAKALDADAETNRLIDNALAIDPDGSRARDSAASARVYRAIARDNRAAFDSIMRNAPVVMDPRDGKRYHQCGMYRVEAAE